VPHYYNTSWQPQYLTRDNLYQRVVNLNVPGAVTVVSVDDFTRGVDWRRARKADRNMLASVNPVLDPLLVTPLRNAVVHSAWGRGKIDIPPGIAKKLNDTTVVTSTPPVAKQMRVNNAPDHVKSQKFQVRDERQERRGPPQVSQQQRQQPVEQPRNRGQEQREARRIEQPPRPQRPQPQPQPQQSRGQQKLIERRQEQPQGERVAAPARVQPQPQPKHERPPQAQQQQQPKPQQQKQERGNPGKGKGKKP
jgi:hypothetical protein